MTGAHTGAAIVVDQDHVVGIITDGDLRRFVCNHDITSAWAVNCMTKNPITMVSSKTIEEAMEVFRHHSIGDIPIVNEMLVPIGMLSLKDLAKLI
jgi:arabinose-5-phosphate isomerase